MSIENICKTAVLNSIQSNLRPLFKNRNTFKTLFRGYELLFLIKLGCPIISWLHLDTLTWSFCPDKPIDSYPEDLCSRIPPTRSLISLSLSLSLLDFLLPYYNICNVTIESLARSSLYINSTGKQWLTFSRKQATGGLLSFKCTVTISFRFYCLWKLWTRLIHMVRAVINVDFSVFKKSQCESNWKLICKYTCDTSNSCAGIHHKKTF